MEAVLSLIFQNIDEKITSYKKRNLKLFQDLKINTNISMIIVSKKKSAEHQKILKNILEVIDEERFPAKHGEYQACLINMKEFMELKEFYLHFDAVVQASEEFLYLEDIKYYEYLPNCLTLFISLEKLELYNKNLEDSGASTNTVFQEFPSISEQMTNWNEA